jgi:hypothetical protein
MVTRSRWKFGCALVSALCMLLIMSCFLTAAVIQRRTVGPPDINLAIGSVHLVAYATNWPDCPPYGGRKPPIAAICGSDSIFSSAQAYTVWIFFPGRASPSGLPRTTFRRLVLLPID